MVAVAKKKDQCPKCQNPKLVTSELCSRCYRKHPNTGSREDKWDRKVSSQFLSMSLKP